MLKKLIHIRSVIVVNQRTIKNFGHKREPIPLVTTIWHGFLTFTFIGCSLNWEKLSKFVFGEINKEIQDKQSENKNLT